MQAYRGYTGVKAMVLPGRTPSLRHDRDELYKLLNDIPDYELVPLRDKVVKYVDLIEFKTSPKSPINSGLDINTGAAFLRKFTNPKMKFGRII